MRRDDQAPLAPRFARAVGAQELGDGVDRRLDGQDVEPDTGEMPALQELGQRVDIDDRPARGAYLLQMGRTADRPSSISNC